MATAPYNPPYQTVNFHFRISFGANTSDIRFQSVTGLDSTIETETVKEGGLNQFTHVVPVRRKYGPLVLKRGLLIADDSPVTQWLQQAFYDEIIVPMDTVMVSLLSDGNSVGSSSHDPMLSWTLGHVWPLSWKIGELNAETGAVLIETLELNYNTLVMDRV